MDRKETIAFDTLKDNIEIVFDIGARTDRDLYDIKPSCQFHLFEPNKTFFDALKKSFEGIHNVYPNQYGISDEILDDQVYYENTQSFIKSPVVSSTHGGSIYNLKTIDWYVENNTIPYIDFLKIDAEGMDYKILLGASNTMKNKGIKFIQFEYWDGVKKFVELLQDTYDLYFIRDDLRFSFIDEGVMNEIDNHRIPRGMGGDVIAVHKKENIKL